VKFVDVIEARKDLRSHPRGGKIPITAGASGKVILSFMQDNGHRKFSKNRGCETSQREEDNGSDLFSTRSPKPEKQGYALAFYEFLQSTTARREQPQSGLENRFVWRFWVVCISPLQTSVNKKVGRKIIEQQS